MGLKVKISGARLSFSSLWEATDYQNDKKFAYRATLLVPASGGEATAAIGGATTPTVWGPFKTARRAIEEAILTVAKDAWKEKGAAVVERNKGSTKDHCFTDGALKEYDGYAGNFALVCRRPREAGAPKVLGRNAEELQNDGTLFDGCFVNASVELWPQDNKNGKAVRCTLLGVQLLRKSDAFSGVRAASADDFEALADDAAADDLE